MICKLCRSINFINSMYGMSLEFDMDQYDEMIEIKMEMYMDEYEFMVGNYWNDDETFKQVIV